MLINRSQLTHVGQDRLAADASDLGWKPGQWPTSFKVGVLEPRIYIQAEFQVSEGDLMWVLYKNGHMTIKVFND